jgi:membrane dipeptidase
MLIFDSHLDLGLNAVDWNRDLRMTVQDIRAAERTCGMEGEKGRCTNTVSFPELRKAEVGVGVATVLARQEVPVNHPMGYTTPEACYAVAMSHLAYYRAMERTGYMKLLRTRGELQRHVSEYQNNSNCPPGFILSMECGDPVLDPENIFEWHENGLRAIGITHYGPNRYGGGTRCEVGLAVDAIPLLKNIAQLGIALDLTHLSDKAFWQVADRFEGRVLASHQNARKFCSWQRQFSDEQIRFVIERDGVLGMAFDIIMLQEGYVRSVSPRIETIERAVDNIDHICQMAGNVRHVGIGSDLDGGYGCEQTPADLDTIADLQKMPAMLQARGYSDGDIAAIMHGNWIRFFSETLPA